MMFWKMLLHPGVVFGFLSDFQKIANACVQEKRIPTREETIRLLKDAEDLFLSGVVPIPGLKGDEVANALKEIESKL